MAKLDDPPIFLCYDRSDGARGVSGPHSLVLGSISHGVLQHAHRPVLVVPAGARPQAEAAEAPDGVASRVESLR